MTPTNTDYKSIEEQVEEFLQDNYEASIKQASTGNYPTIQKVMIRLTRALQERDAIARQQEREKIKFLEKVKDNYLAIEEKGSPNKVMQAQIHGFKQAYNLIVSGEFDKPLALTPNDKE